MMEEFVTRKVVASYLGVNEQTVRAFIKNERLKIKWFGSISKVSMESAEELLVELEERRKIRITSDKWINRGDIL